MCDILLTQVGGMGSESMVEGLAIDILSMGWQMALDRDRKISIGSIRHLKILQPFLATVTCHWRNERKLI